MRKGDVTKRGFLAHLENVYYEPNTGCWLWPGQVNSGGYGITIWEGKQRLAHRISYEYHIGPIPDGLYVCHKCDVPSCINPGHFFVGTQVDNMQDMIAKGRRKYKSGYKSPGRGGWTYNRKPSKLTDDQVREIYSSTETCRSLAEAYGVSFGLISNIKLRKSRAKCLLLLS